MIPQDLVAEIGRLVREMPRNPTVIAVDQKLKAALVADPVAVTAVAATADVAATSCLICEARRARQRAKMKRYREGIK